MKCDLHVHSRHSGMCTLPIFEHFCRESYNHPAALYDTLKQRGMDLVTVTDHDSMEANSELCALPDFFLSEEVTCRMPSGTELHVGVYDISERQHTEIQRRRDDLESLVAYLREQQIFFSVNHIFSSLTGRRVTEDFDLCENLFPAAETLNGHLLAKSNHCAAQLTGWQKKAPVGGSDGHTLRSAGTAWTEVPGARNKEEYLAGLRAGRGRVAGESGSYWKLTRDVYLIVGAMLAESPWTAPLAPLAAIVPLWTLVNYVQEVAFARHWMRALAKSREIPLGHPHWRVTNPSWEVLT